MTILCTIILLGGIAVFLMPGLVCVLFSGSKQQKAYRACMRKYRNLRALAESGCRQRETAETFWQKSAELFRRAEKNKGMRGGKTDAAMLTLASIEEKLRALKAAREELEMINHAYTSRGKRLNAYCYVSMAIFGLVLKTLLTTAVFAAIAAVAFGMCLFLGLYLLDRSGSGIPLVADLMTESVDVARVVMVLLIVSLLLVFMISMQKVTKMLIILIDLLFDGGKITAHIVLSEKVNTEQLINDIGAIAHGVKRKNSSGFFSSFFHNLSE